jgi:hypothetical protein
MNGKILVEFSRGKGYKILSIFTPANRSKFHIFPINERANLSGIFQRKNAIISAIIKRMISVP